MELLDDPSGVRVIVLTGEQDLASAGALRLAFAGAREAGRGVVVELSIVSFVDSTILGAIVEVSASARRTAGASRSWPRIETTRQCRACSA